MIRQGLITGSVAVVTATAGVVAASSGAVDVIGDGTARAPRDQVAITACPDGETIGTLRRGDRVYATGTDTSGDFVEIESPWVDGERVWVASGDIDPDDTLDGLPESDCDPSAFSITLANGERVVVTTTVPEDADDEDEDQDQEDDQEEVVDDTATTTPATTRPDSTTTTTRATTTTSTTTTSTTTTSTTTTSTAQRTCDASMRNTSAAPPAAAAALRGHKSHARRDVNPARA